MSLWCRMKMGEDSWTDFTIEYLTFGIVALLCMLLCGCGTAKGDVLMMWHDVDTTVSPETGPLVVEIGTGFSGNGRPLGWLDFRATQERGAELVTGTWSDQYGTDDGTQTLKIHAVQQGGNDFAVLSANGAVIPDADFLSDWVTLWDDQSTFPDGLTYVMFNWSSYIKGNQGDAFGQMYVGRGWISFNQIHTEQAEPGMADKPSYVVRQVALGTDMRLTGQLTTAVPEPSTWCALAAVVALTLWRRVR